MNRKQASAMASAVAFMFGAAAGCTSEVVEDNEVEANAMTLRCQGINTCEGTSECASADDANACHGQNSCAGMGWVTVESEEECTDQGGTLLES